jgi:hypothetical protein
VTQISLFTVIIRHTARATHLSVSTRDAAGELSITHSLKKLHVTQKTGAFSTDWHCDNLLKNGRANFRNFSRWNIEKPACVVCETFSVSPDRFHRPLFIRKAIQCDYLSSLLFSGFYRHQPTPVPFVALIR